MGNVKIEDKALNIILGDLENAYPQEGCGFLLGRLVDNDTRLIESAIAVYNYNETDKERLYEINPYDYSSAERYAEDLGLTLLGTYHSHPDCAAVPSEEDIKHAVPFFSYLIVTIQNGKMDHIRSWKLNEDRQFEEETVL